MDEGDRYELHQRLEQAIGERAAGTLMTELGGFRPAELATKQDLALTREELKREMADVRTEMAELRTELRTEMAELRTELRTGLADVRTEIHRVVNDAITAQTKTLMLGLVFSLIGSNVTVAALAFGAARLGAG